MNVLETLIMKVDVKYCHLNSMKRFYLKSFNTTFEVQIIQSIIPFSLNWFIIPVPGESWSFTTGGHEDTPQDLGSGVLGQGSSVRFLTPNNSRILAHHGSSVRMPCRIEKPPNSAMVRFNSVHLKCWSQSQSCCKVQCQQ